jgi:DDE family transposase
MKVAIYVRVSPTVRPRHKLFTIAAIYKDRWQVELFFKALKQTLKIKTFMGTGANAVRTRVLTALIEMLVLKYLQLKSKFSWSLSTLAALLRQQLSSIAICGLGWTILFRPHRHWLGCTTARNSLRSRGRRRWTAEKRAKANNIGIRPSRTYSDEHFSVDGTLIEAWASQKSFQKKDGGPGQFRRRAAEQRDA